MEDTMISKERTAPPEFASARAGSPDLCQAITVASPTNGKALPPMEGNGLIAEVSRPVKPFGD